MTPEVWRATGVAAVLLAEIVAGDSLVAATYETTDDLMAYMSSSTSQYSLIFSIYSQRKILFTDALDFSESSTLEPKLSSVSPPTETTMMREIKKIEVFSSDFARVETPFLIGMWIFCASIAKIGKST